MKPDPNMSIITEDVSPNGLGILQYIARQNFDWWQAIAEWIDNAIDANASKVRIEFQGRSLVIMDNGDGCESPGKIVAFGDHHPHRTTKVGRYGIGGKQAALWAGGVDSIISIRTVFKGTVRLFDARWKTIVAHPDPVGRWHIEGTQESAAPEDVGTTLTITPVVRQVPSSKPWAELLERLGYLFSPAMKDGCEIEMKRSAKAPWQPLPKWKLPEFQGPHVDTNIIVAGKGARVYCGVVADGVPNPRCGLTYLYEWRVIEQASANGCGRFSPARICGFVDLDRAWLLTTHKDSIDRDQSRQLYREVEQVVRPLLERADKMGIELRSHDFDQEVNLCLNKAITAGAADAAGNRVKAKRKPPENHPGPVEPKNTPRRHKRAEVEQPGDRFFSKLDENIGCFRVDYAELVEAEIGQIRLPSTILLNSNNAAVAKAKNESNRDLIVCFALSLLTVEHCTTSHGVLDKLYPAGYTTEHFSRNLGQLITKLNEPVPEMA